MQIFSASRLTFARKRKKITKIQLAEKTGLSLKAISDYENERLVPKDSTLTKIAEALEFPVDFFYGESLVEISENAASFRASTKLSAKQKHSVLSAGGIAILLNSWIEERFDLPQHCLMDMRDVAPDVAAVTLRQNWRLGELSIKNMIHLLESKGVRVYSLVEDSRDVDAFSIWHEGKPFIFLNTFKTAERSRFDAAHELGHLVLHKHGVPQDQNAEIEANRFASEFLMPSNPVRTVCSRYPTLDALIKLKSQWIVSVSALAYRIKALNLITDWQYRMLNIAISEKGYKTYEPNPATRETSLLLNKIFETLKNDGIGVNTIAKELKVNPSEIKKLIFNLSLTSVNGGSNSKGRNNISKASLEVIK